MPSKNGEPVKQPLKPKKFPERKCIGCGEKKKKTELIRIVRSPEGEISLDFTGRKPGRGHHSCRDKISFRGTYLRDDTERVYSGCCDKIRKKSE